MIRRALFLSLTLSAGLAAGQRSPSPSGPGAGAPPSAASAHGVDQASMDRSVAPGDDFFAYGNGTWVKNTEIPADKASWSTFGELALKTNHELRAILEAAARAPAGTEARKVGDFYAAFMDEATIEKKGRAPLEPVLARINGIKDKNALARVLGEDLRADVDPMNNGVFVTDRFLGLWVAPAFAGESRYVPYFLQGGLGMPDREYYTSAEPKMAELRAQYRAHVAAVFKLAGLRDGAARAERVMALEMKMAAVHASREASQDVRKANNPWPRADFAKQAPGLDWDVFLGAAKLDGQPIFYVWQPDAVRGLSALVASEPLAAWKDWLAFHAVDRLSPVLPAAFVKENFAFGGKALTGVPQLAERWKRAVGATSASLGEAVGHLYVEQKFTPAAKAQVQAMVGKIIAAFRARIDKLDWMAEATKARAKEKLATLYVGVGYPDKWRDYSGLSVVAGDAAGNAQRAELFELQRNLAKLGKPVDTSEWCMSPQTVNAVNLPLQNALNFPAAILQPPNFDPAASDAANYGSIGAVIGHEISHSFDDQGAQFDAQGRLTDWWTAADRAHFEASGAALAAQYDAYAPFPDLHVNGKLTLSENIADLAGLSAAHDAWLTTKNGTEQDFFVAYAQSWRGKEREPLLRQLIITNGHAPRRYRVATVRNMDAWYDTFGVKPGQKLYLAPAERVRVW